MILCRFTRDLRLDDHAALAAASERGAVLPVLVLDEQARDALRRSPRRAAFYLGAVRALDDALRERGSRLVVRRGDPARALVQLARELHAEGVVWSARYDGASAREDLLLRAQLEEAGLHAECVHDAPAIPPEETERGSDGSGYRAFAPYFERWRARRITSYDLPILLRFADAGAQSEALPDAAELGVTRAAGDATPQDALAALKSFLAGPARVYASARRVAAEEGTSRLAAPLSFGTLALRTAVHATRDALDNPFLLPEERQSLRLFLRSLAMRDFFLQLAWLHPESDRLALQERMHGFPFASDHPALDAWREGATGFPLVDAGMRQLKETGWMHPQVRAVTASFLCFDLGVDWRIGRDSWESMLIEDDPAIATGNWQWIAGVGADLAQHPRIYNPERQQRSTDPDGRYVRRYVPELAHEPFAPRGREREPMLALFDRSRYPAPVVNHAAAARAFLERYRVYAAATSVAQEKREKRRLRQGSVAPSD